MRGGRIAAGLPQGAPLPQQVPALVELRLHGSEALALLLVERSLVEEPVLLRNQALDVGQHRSVLLALVFHARSFVRNVRTRTLYREETAGARLPRHCH